MPNLVSINPNELESNIIYRATATCYALYQTIEPTSCEQSLYFIDYIDDYNNSTSFKIDYETVIIYYYYYNYE